jgi:hypothetical protein
LAVFSAAFFTSSSGLGSPHETITPRAKAKIRMKEIILAVFFIIPNLSVNLVDSAKVFLSLTHLADEKASCGEAWRQVIKALLPLLSL